MTLQLTLRVTEDEQRYHAWFEEVGQKYGYTAETPDGAARGAVAMIEDHIDVLLEG
jgi:hypothetical protein